MNRFVLLLVLAAPVAAHANQVDRSRATLARLADESDRIVLAKVATVTETRVTFSVEDTLKGTESLASMPRNSDVARWVEGERAVFFFQEYSSGELRPLFSDLHRVVVSSDEEAKLVVDAVRKRLPRLGGAEASLPWADLLSTVARIREDAAHELVGRRELRATPEDTLLVARALSTAPGPEVVELAGRLGDRALAAPLARLLPEVPFLRDVARALGRVDRAAGLEAISTLPKEKAIPALGALGGEESARRLAACLEEKTLARPALEALLECEGAAAVASTIASIARAGGELGRLAVRALALAGAGAELAALEESGPEELRELVSELRAEPSKAR